MLQRQNVVIYFNFSPLASTNIILETRKNAHTHIGMRISVYSPCFGIVCVIWTYVYEMNTIPGFWYENERNIFGLKFVVMKFILFYTLYLVTLENVLMSFDSLQLCILFFQTIKHIQTKFRT